MFALTVYMAIALASETLANETLANETLRVPVRCVRRLMQSLPLRAPVTVNKDIP